MGAVSQKSCGVFATPGATLSSNSKIYIIYNFIFRMPYFI